MNFNKFEGKVKIDDYFFNFYYYDKVITIFPNNVEESWNNYRGLSYHDRKFQKQISLLNGILRAGNSVAFIDVTLDCYGRGYYRGYVPAMVISKANAYSNLPDVGNIESIAFIGECIDKLVKPKRWLNKQKYDSNNKIPIINFKSASDVIKRYNFDKDILELNIRFNMDNKNLNTPITLESELSIIFNKKKSILDVMNYYKKVYKTLCFIFNRNCMKFSDIVLSRKIKVIHNDYEDDKVVKKIKTETLTYSLIINDKINDNYDINNIDIDAETLFPNFYELCEITNSKMFPLNYYPKNKYGDTHFDNYKFIKVASAFEGQFDLVFNKYKSTKRKKYKETKQQLLNFISDSKRDKNSEVRGYLNNFYKIIETCEGSLSEQINHSMKIYKNCIERKKQILFNDFNLSGKSNNDISLAFQEKRNMLVHTSINNDFNNIEVVGYVIVKMLVHCLVLQRANFNKESIIKIINSIFIQ